MSTGKHVDLHKDQRFAEIQEEWSSKRELKKNDKMGMLFELAMIRYKELKEAGIDIDDLKGGEDI